MKLLNYLIEAKTFAEEMKAELKYALKHRALNAYGKKPSELTKQELYNTLDAIFKNLFVLVGDKKEEFKEIFKTTFSKELKKAKS